MCSCLWAGLVNLAHTFLWEASNLIFAPLHAVLIGLESSGKTTILFRLKYQQYVNAVPTVGFNTEKVRTGGGSWLIWDVGGAERVRPLWRSYTRATDALIFVVDSSDTDERLEEARTELHRLVKQQTAQCIVLKRPRPPILVLANKQDLSNVREPSMLTKALGLHDFPPTQSWTIASVCAVTGEGLDEAMASLNQIFIKSKKSSS